MILYDIEFDILDGWTIDETFSNAKELEKLVCDLRKRHIINRWPIQKITDILVNIFAKSVKPSLWHQFSISEWDYDNLDGLGIPEYLGKRTLADWIYK